MEKVPEHVAARRQQPSGEGLGLGIHAEEETTLNQILHQTPDAVLPTHTGKSTPSTSPSRNDFYDGCFGTFPKFFASGHLDPEGGIPSSLSPLDDLSGRRRVYPLFAPYQSRNRRVRVITLWFKGLPKHGQETR